MADHPNILFLMTDQMQGRALRPDHPCITPNLDKLMARGVTFDRAYTTNAVCSPARASLMTGLLPHSHGVTTVTHCVSPDQAVLRTEHPHWAQRLADAGYHNALFGKWHVERSGNLSQFGWHVDGTNSSDLWQERNREVIEAAKIHQRYKGEFSLIHHVKTDGYDDSILYAVTDCPPEDRGVGITTGLALEFIEDRANKEGPWCCMASVLEPHDPFIVGQEAFDQYDVDAIELPANVHAPFEGKPNLYRRAAGIFADMTDQQHREATACYWAMITEIDQQFGRLIDALERTGQADNTVIIFTTDHGEMLGAHGMYMKNVGGYEEVYNIPLVMAGPNVAAGVRTTARVGLHDLCPTLCDVAGVEAIDSPDSRSFAELLPQPKPHEARYTRGFAEYHGTRQPLMQRIVYDGDWKLVWNGFDFDELYNLADDPLEMNNRADDAACADIVRRMMAYAWKVVRDTNDHSVLRTHYPILRFSAVGPNIAETP